MRRTLLATALSLVTLASASTASFAQTDGGTKIAVVNPARVFQEMQETKDLKQKLETERVSVEAEVKARQQKVRDLQAARDLLKSDSPQFQEAEKAFMKEAIDFDTWSKLKQAELQGNQKTQMKSLFDKIVGSTQEVAAVKGIDLVIADQRPELPDNLGQITVEQLRTVLNQRNVLVAAEKVDLTKDVIAKLDEKYKAGGAPPAAAAPATPATPATPVPAAK